MRSSMQGLITADWSPPNLLQFLFCPAVHRPMQYEHGDYDSTGCKCCRCELHARAQL